MEAGAPAAVRRGGQSVRAAGAAKMSLAGLVASGEETL
jgi:hypothetical protein